MPITSQLFYEGVEIKDGSVEAVELYCKMLRDAEELVLEAREVLARCPDEVERVWLKGQIALEKELSAQTQPVGRFLTDFRARGLESAVGDAKFRKEL
jgi:hypothetical protein